MQGELNRDSSIQIFQPNDSLFISLDKYPQKTYYHQVKPGQTIYSISRFFGFKPKELKYYNPLLKDTLSIGQILEIPIPNRAIYRFEPENKSSYIPLYYKVQPKDNLYRLSKVILRMPLDTIMQRNNLQQASISIGQILHMGWMLKSGIHESLQLKQGYNYRNAKNRLAFIEFAGVDTLAYNQNGAAFSDISVQDNGELLAMHNKAPINSILAVTHPHNNRTVYAKVIGRIPSINRDTVVILSQAAARYLGAINKRFYVKIQHQ